MSLGDQYFYGPAPLESKIPTAISTSVTTDIFLLRMKILISESQNDLRKTPEKMPQRQKSLTDNS